MSTYPIPIHRSRSARKAPIIKRRKRAEERIGSMLDHVVGRAMQLKPRVKALEWTEEEDQFVRDNLGYLTDAQMGKQLGRSPTGVHLRWSRDLHLPSPSKHPDWITAHKAAQMLGIDSHKTAGWVDMGLIPGRLLPTDRKIRMIRRVTFLRWACAPANWVWFDPKKVRDPKLKRLLQLEAKRWDDEWWSTRQVADYHGADTTDVKRYIKLGRLRSYHLPVARGGRHRNRKWSNHFILKSEAVKVTFFRMGQVFPNHSALGFTPAADAFLLKAHDQWGLTFVAIGKMMKIGKQKRNSYGIGGTNAAIANRYKWLKEQGAESGRQQAARKRRETVGRKQKSGGRRK